MSGVSVRGYKTKPYMMRPGPSNCAVLIGEYSYAAVREGFLQRNKELSLEAETSLLALNKTLD